MPLTVEDKAETKRFLDHALRILGHADITDLARVLHYKSLPRIYRGEFPLPAARRRHITDLVTVRERELHEPNPRVSGSQGSYKISTTVRDAEDVDLTIPLPGPKFQALLQALPPSHLQAAAHRLMQDPDPDKLSVVREILAEYDRRLNAQPPATPE